MSGVSSIEWTDKSWNPVRGCSIVSPGCTNCYAMKFAHRFSGAGQAYEGLTMMTKGGPVWTGKVRLVERDLGAPLRWRKPARIFVNSMSDLFHEDLSGEAIDLVFRTMGACDDQQLGHVFQILTKRPARMLQYMTTRARAAWNGPRMNRTAFPPRNVWLGVSVEDQARANERIPLLLKTPAAVRWISAEPLLGAIDLAPDFGNYEAEAWLHGQRRYGEAGDAAGIGGGVVVENTSRLDWVVAGGESGPGARPVHPDWVRSLRDQCAAVAAPFFFKQWGTWLPRTDYYAEGHVRDQWCDRAGYGRGVQLLTPEGHEWVVGDPGTRGRHDGQPPPGTWVVQRLDKKTSGRTLDGRTHDEYPA